MLKVGRGASAPPFIVMDVIAAANARQSALSPGAAHVIRMEVGQPGTGAPAGAVTAAVAALRSGDSSGYTEAFGRRSLRERIVSHYRDWYGLEVPLDRVAVTVGASGGFPLAFLGAFDPGDRVALTSPFYPPYVNILTALGVQPVILEAGPESRFQPSLAMLEKLDPPPDGLIVASPCNPAGTMLHPDELAAIAAWCDAAGVRLISDEIYHGLNYDSAITTAAALSPHAIAVNSFSKYFAMTGWRIGWLILPEDLVRPVERLAQNLFISAPHISQVAAEAAFDCHDELQANVDVIGGRGIICSARCRTPALPGCRQPKVRFTCSPTSRTGRMTARRSAPHAGGGGIAATLGWTPTTRAATILRFRIRVRKPDMVGRRSDGTCVVIERLQGAIWN